MNIDYKNIKSFSGEWKEEIALNFIKEDCDNLYYIPAELRKNKNFILKCIEINLSVLYIYNGLDEKELKVLKKIKNKSNFWKNDKYLIYFTKKIV